MAIIMVSTFTACEEIPLTALDSLAEAFTNRINANINIANNLYNAGLIGETTKDNIIDKIDNIREDIIVKLQSGNEDKVMSALSAIAPALIDWGGVEPDYSCSGDDHTGVACCDAKVKENFITEADGVLERIAKYAVLETKGATIEPLEIVDSSSADTLMQTMQYPIYVINNNRSIEEITAFLNEYIEGSTVDDEFLEKSYTYFYELKDENGNPVTLLDPDDKSNQLVQYSTTENAPYVGDDNIVNGEFGDSDTYGSKDGIADVYSKTNTPGKDMVITQHSNYNVAVVRFREFNTDAYNKIIKTLGLGDDKYLVVPTESGGRIYLLQYPVGYIKDFHLNDTKDRYEANIGKSQLEINLKTKKMYKVTTRNDKLNYTDIGEIVGDTTTAGDTSNSGVSAVKQAEISSLDSYLNVSLDSPETSSFVVYGETGIDKSDTPSKDKKAWNLEFGESGVKVSIPRIVLRDYLEISYAPGVSGDTDGGIYKELAVYGRMIRIQNFDAELSTPVAKYRNVDGTVPTTATSLYISDFSDKKSLCEAQVPYIKYIPSSTGEGISTSSDISELENSLKDDSTYKTDKIENLRAIAIDKIECTVPFPTTDLGFKDMSFKDDKPFFYGIVVRKNSLESGLLTWATSESTTESTLWWNSWLKDHNFIYRIDSDSLLQYLSNSYTYELSQSGYILLNLDTLTKIQEDMTNEANLNRTHNMRTFFKVLGYALVGYAFILMMCWVVDTSTDFGINLLEIASFGRLVAISGSEEVAGLNTGNTRTHFVDFNKICLASLKVLFIGILLIFVDIVSIVVLVSETLGQIGRYIGSLLE